MKENSMKEDIERIKQRIEDVKEYLEYGLPYNEYLDLKNSFDHILSDYKRVLKENEELLREKIDNKKIIALAQNEFLGYEQGYQDGKAGRGSATQAIIEGQQYYIIQEQFERYKNQIEKLQKENEELKHKYDKALGDLVKTEKENEEWQRAYQEEKDKQFALIQNTTNNTIKTANIAIKDLQEKLKEVITKQKVKDKIEELKEEYKTDLEKNSTRAFILKCQITILEDLLEEKEDKQ